MVEEVRHKEGLNRINSLLEKWGVDTEDVVIKKVIEIPETTSEDYVDFDDDSENGCGN